MQGWIELVTGGLCGITLIDTAYWAFILAFFCGMSARNFEHGEGRAV